jgi:hypothetical protein
LPFLPPVLKIYLKQLTAAKSLVAFSLNTKTEFFDSAKD